MTDEVPPTAASDEAPAAPDSAASPGDAPAAEAPAAGALQAAGGPNPKAPPAEALPRAYRPNFVFLGVVAFVTLALDLGSKAWAKSRLEDPKAITDRIVEVVHDHLYFQFAGNQGGAWGLLSNEPEWIRRPFFLGISFVAIAFIVSLYRKLTRQQWALKWGLPLVLGGALGNLVNRIQLNYVVDFILYRAGWVKVLNGFFTKRPSDAWPTFNVADVAIVAGVVLMAVDMFTPRKPVPKPSAVATAPAADEAAPPSVSETAPDDAAPAPTPKET